MLKGNDTDDSQMNLQISTTNTNCFGLNLPLDTVMPFPLVFVDDLHVNRFKTGIACLDRKKTHFKSIIKFVLLIKIKRGYYCF